MGGVTAAQEGGATTDDLLDALDVLWREERNMGAYHTWTLVHKLVGRTHGWRVPSRYV